jgi:hypothetical protein
MADVTPLTVTMPALVTVPGVEVLHVGDSWPAATGPLTISHVDLTDIIAAAADPLMPRAVLKLGHDDEEFNGADPYDYQGLPALGRLDNYRLSANSEALVVDVVGVPAWLAHIWPTAYPHRSVELFDGAALPWASAQTSSKHRIFLGGLALLGGWPAITGLADVPALYGIEPITLAASDAAPTIVRLDAEPEHAMPQPIVSATVNLQEVTEAIYAREQSWGWVIEYGADSAGMFAVYENDAGMWRIPFAVDSGDAVNLGEATRVRYTLVDAADDDAAPPLATAGAATEAATTAGRPVMVARYAPADQRAVRVLHAHPDTIAATEPESAQEGATPMNAQELREQIGLEPEATDEDVAARLAQLPPVTATEDAPPVNDPTPAPSQPVAATTRDGRVEIDADTLAGLRADAAAGREAREQQRLEDRDRVITAAVNEGRITPARRDHYAQAWESDPDGIRTLLSAAPDDGGLAPGLVPVTERGHADPTGAASAGTAEYDRIIAARGLNQSR